MTFVQTYAVLPVRDFEAAKAWYEKLFDRPAAEEPMPGLAQWDVTDTSGVQVLHDEVDAGHGLVTLGTDDLDGLGRDLAGRGLELGEPTRGVISTIAALTDPDGNTLTFAQSHETQPHEAG